MCRGRKDRWRQRGRKAREDEGRWKSGRREIVRERKRERETAKP